MLRQLLFVVVSAQAPRKALGASKAMPQKPVDAGFEGGGVKRLGKRAIVRSVGTEWAYGLFTVRIGSES